MSDKKKDEKSPFAGALADKLKDLDIDTSAKEKSAKERQEAEDESQPQQQDARPKEAQKEASPTQREARRDIDSELSDEELFRQAVENIDRETIERAHMPPPREQSRSDTARPSGDRDVEDRDDKARSEPSTGRPDDRGEPSKPLSERELFEKTVADLDSADVYSGKFEGKGPKLPPPEEVLPEEDDDETAPRKQGSDGEFSEEDAREALSEQREIRQFEKAVGPVDKKNERRRKYRKPTRPDPEEHVKQVTSYRSDSPADMITPPLPKSGEGLNNVGSLNAAQKDLLDRYKKRNRRHEIGEINVRGDTVDDALRQIELFVHQKWKENARFVRIIHGRGLQSEGDPVLKPAVLRWLEGPGYRYVKGYVPEVNSAGDYGSVIVQLEQKD